MLERVVTVRFSDADAETLAAIARIEDRKISQVVRRIVTATLRGKPSEGPRA